MITLRMFFLSALETQTPEIPVDPVEIPELLQLGVEAVGSYTFEADEYNTPAYAERLYVTGTSQVGQLLTANLEGLVIPNGAAAGTHTYRWYRSLNKTASYEELIGSASTYTIQTGDVGWFIRCEVDVKQVAGSGMNITGQTLKTVYTALILNPGVFSPFADVTTWDTSLDKDTAQGNLANLSYWINRASVDGNATIGVVALPTWDVSKGAVRFTKTSSQSLRVQAAGSYLTPYEVWIEFITPTAWSGTQTLIGLSGTHHIAISSAGVLSVSAVSTGVTLSLNTTYKLRVVFNGASSTWNLNNGGDNAISLSTASVGTPNWRIGCKFADNDYFDGWIKYLFFNDTGLSAGEITNMWTWFGL